MIIAIDFETRSTADLKRLGAWRYSKDPSTDVYCAVFGWEPAGKFVWSPEEKARHPYHDLRFDPDAIYLAHNSAFERAIWTNVLHPRHGWPPCPPIERWLDTQAEAAAANLPPTLEGLAAALGVPVQKDMPGHELMLKMSKDTPGVVNPHDTPANRARLLSYCEQDVKATLQCWAAVPKMTKEERAIWHLDQTINARGLFIDVPFVRKMRALADRRVADLRNEAFLTTGGELTDAAHTPRVKKWLVEQGVELPEVARVNTKGEKVKSASIGRNIAKELAEDEDIEWEVQRVLANRIEAGKATSLAKLRKVEDLVDPDDGRVRGSLQFCAAHTGRWSSRGLQVHNLPRDKRKPEEIQRVRDIIERTEA